MSPYPPLGLIRLPWYVVMAAPLYAEEMSREAWIDELAAKWGLVRRALVTKLAVERCYHEHPQR